MKQLLLALALVVWVPIGWGTDASPHSYDVLQPDGRSITLRIHGNEFLHYETDERGYTVLNDRNWYVYARQNEQTGRLVSTGLRVGIDDPRRHGLGRHQRPSVGAQRADREEVHGLVDGEHDHESTEPVTTTASSLKNLVVLIRWSDHGTRTLPDTSAIDILMNHVGPHATYAPTGSVRDVYLENSYGSLELNSTVAVWVTVDNTEAYYANGNSGLTSRTHDALRYALNVLDADPTIQFTDFDQDADGQIDAITFLHSGYGAEWGGNDCDGANYADRIWSHKWSIFGGWTGTEGVSVSEYHISPAVWGTCGSTIGRIGVIAHETGHFLGLPDLYDTDSSAGNGIGSYGLMANSWGFDGSQYYPPHFSPWSKVRLGWLSETEVTSAGTYSVPAVESNATVYRVNLGYSANEYLLIENRQPSGFDAAMPQGGLAIWHIDELAGYSTEGYPGQTGWPSNGNHYRVALLQADGDYDLEKGVNRGDAQDVWHAGFVNELGPSSDPSTGPFPNTDAYQSGTVVQTGNRIYNISASGATMTFSFEVAGAPSDPPVAPSSLVATAASYQQIDLQWQDNADNEDGFRIERALDGVSFSELATVSADVSSYADTGLSPSTSYSYRVLAYNAVGDSEYSADATATTHAAPPPPAAPANLQASATSDSEIALTWEDQSADEVDFEIRRSLDAVNWTMVGIVPANTSSYGDGGLTAETTYHYQVYSRSAWGISGSNVASGTTEAAPAYVDQVADWDVPVSGTVTGTYQDTWEMDGISQAIRERQSGGKPSRRRSFLEHQWQFSNVRGGLAITLFAGASAPANGEGDDFDFEVSRDGGQSWASTLRVSNGTPEGTLHAGPLPSSDPGTILVRVVDTDDTPGNRSLDEVRVDQLLLRTDLDPNDFPPEAPSGLTATAAAAGTVELSWVDHASNERGFRVMRSTDGVNFTEIGTAPIDASSYSDSEVSPNTSYTYKVVAFTSSYTAESATASVTTPDGINLSASGVKRRGKISVTLSWEGGTSASTLDIWRSVNGATFTLLNGVSNSGSGSYTDHTGLKGGQTLSYRLCTPDGSLCSDTATVVF